MNTDISTSTIAKMSLIENPRTDADRRHNFAVSSAKIVGAVYVKNPGPWWIPPGLESTHDMPSTYRTVFFGAKHEYENDDEGWQTVNHNARRDRRRIRRNQRKARMMIVDNESVVAE